MDRFEQTIVFTRRGVQGYHSPRIFKILRGAGS